MKMTISAKRLLRALELRVAEISAQQHALALERTRLQEQLTPLRLGVLAPETALVHLRGYGITLRGLSTSHAARRRSPPDVVLKAVPRGPATAPPGEPIPVRELPIPLSRSRLPSGS
jgi:hypothetical protein